MQRVFAATLAVAGCSVAPASAQDETAIGLENAFPNLRFARPVALYQAPGETRWFLIEQRGRVLSFPNDPAVRRASVFIDIRDRVDDGPNEAGLLGLAFHPAYRQNRQVFLSYTKRGSPLVSVISRFSASADGRTLDPNSERTILTLAQPFGNHNGGQISFGPDGHLYAGFGDGGAGGDPQGNGQNTHTLLGAMLRIDVDGAEPYGVPADNPFASGGGRPEIYAWGLRNPWRWSFDSSTGELWVGDVGQNRIEEIDRIEKGGNYGWNIREGTAPYRPRGRGSAGLIDPVAEYEHDLGCSVTGGYVYRGADIPALSGTYVFGDFCSGRIWGLFGESGAPVLRQLLDSDLTISSFAEGHDGSLYVLDWRGGGIHRLVAGAAAN